MVRQLQLGVVDAVELEEHPEEVRLAVGEETRDGLAHAQELPCSEVLAVEHLLRLHQLRVEVG